MFRLTKKWAGSIVLASLALLTCGLALSPKVALADYVVYDTQVDSYHVTVWARPNPISVGKVNLLIRLGRKANVAQEYPVQNAQVTVEFKQLTGPGTQAGSRLENYHKPLIATQSEPGTYEMQDSLLSDGRYRTIIKLDSTVGKSETSFEFVAQPQPDDRLLSLLLLALFPLGLLTLVFLYVRRPKGSDPAQNDLPDAPHDSTAEQPQETASH